MMGPIDRRRACPEASTPGGSRRLRANSRGSPNESRARSALSTRCDSTSLSAAPIWSHQAEKAGLDHEVLSPALLDLRGVCALDGGPAGSLEARGGWIHGATSVLSVALVLGTVRSARITAVSSVKRDHWSIVRLSSRPPSWVIT